MSYLSGYKRPRPEDTDTGGYVDFGSYAGAPTDFGGLSLPGQGLQALQPQLMQPQLQPQMQPQIQPQLQPQIQPQLQPQMQPQVQTQSTANEAIRLGSAPDGTLPVVKLRGLPFSCDIDSINMFLEVETVDVVLVRRQGRFSGEAFVVLPGMMQVEFALNKHKAYMGKRYVEVQQSCREDYYKAVAAFVDDWSSGQAPPPSQRGYDFRGTIDSGGGRAMSRRDMGHDRDARDMRPPPRERRFDDRDRPGPGAPPATGVLRLRGLPFGVSIEEIAQWFNDAGVLTQPLAPENVYCVMAYDGRPTGSAFVEFSGPTDAENAMIKDKAMMGSRYVELFHSCREELLLATQSRQ